MRAASIINGHDDEDKEKEEEEEEEKKDDDDDNDGMMLLAGCSVFVAGFSAAAVEQLVDDRAVGG